MVLEAAGFRDGAVTTSSVLPAISGICTLLAISLPSDLHLRTNYHFHVHISFSASTSDNLR